MFRFAARRGSASRSSSQFAPADWPVFRGDALMTGVGNGQAARTSSTSKWTFKTGDGKRTGGIEGAPAIVGGVVYVASLDKHLYAIDLATGKQKWKAKLGYDEGVAQREGRPRLRRRPGRQVLLRQRSRREGGLDVRDRRRDHGRRATSTATTSSSARTTRPSTA